MQSAFVVAMAANRVIGRDNQLPWHLPEDLRFFKRVTMGKPIIMGRKTFESIGRPLPGRTNIVVSGNPDFDAEGIRTAASLTAARELGEEVARADGVDEIMIIGGAELFRQAFDTVDRLYLTEIHANIEGDTWFPEFDRQQWRELSREDLSADESNPYDYSFLILERKD